MILQKKNSPKLICTIIVFTIIIFNIDHTIFAASFDCDKAHTGVEKIIYSNKALSLLDSILGRAYDLAISGSDQNQKEIVINDQKHWLKDKLDKCVDIKCLYNEYVGRIGVIKLIKTDKSEAEYVVDKDEMSRQMSNFQESLNDRGFQGTLKCKIMVRLHESYNTGHDSSYGAICSFGDRDIMVCDDTMVGKFTFKFDGFVETGASLADFTEANCPPGG